MARSPIIVHHIENPEDERMKDLAWKEFQSYANAFASKSVFWISNKDLKFYSGMQYQYDLVLSSGIKSLGDKIENIWDIVSLINSVADQAKIIAFNAELEASSAGEAGKNFHIVATEIRRLADGIIDGTKEIKDRIGEIQRSSDQLILMSENGTEKVNEGVKNAKELEEKFSSIKHSAEVTADSSNEITGIVSQQNSSSEQILTTLRQIASGVESFSQETRKVSQSAENVRRIAETLTGQMQTATEPS